MKITKFEDAEYFKKHKYRDPRDYVVESYVMPKVKFIEDTGCFRRAGLKILDVGSGNGTFSWHFRKYSDTVVGLDYSEQLLRRNPGRLKAMATTYQLPFKDGSFDIVFEANLLHHLNSPHCAIKEMKRCSREYLIFIEPNRYNPLMCLLSLAVRPERGGLTSCRKRWEGLIRNLGIEVITGMVTGMISQENTPALLVPFLKPFDFNFCLGEYIVLVCRKLTAAAKSELLYG